MASSWPPKKGVALDLIFRLRNATTGAIIVNPGTYSYEIGKDGGAVDTTPDNAVSELDSSTTGRLKWTLSATEMNADVVDVLCKDDTSGCIPFSMTIYTAANTQDEIVAGTVKQKVDVDTIKTQTVTCEAGVTVLASVGTATASTAQTGDGYALLNTELADLIADIGTNGAGLTALPWNAAWDAEVQSECTDALTAFDFATDAEVAAATKTAMEAEGAHLALILEDTGTTLDDLVDGLESTIGVAGAGLTALGDTRLANLDVAVSTRGTSTYAGGAVASVTGSVGSVAAGGINNASFGADVGSTAYATNIIALAVRKVLDELNLDHLMKVPVADNADMSAEVPDGTVLSNVMSATGDTSDYDQSTDALEALASGGTADWTAGEKEQIRDALGVDGDKTAATGGDLQALAAGLAALGGASTFVVVSPVSADGESIELVQGDDYADADGRALEWSSDAWPDLTAGSVAFHLADSAGTITKAGTVVTGGAGTTQLVRVELTDTETATFDVGFNAFDVEATLASGNKVTLVVGACHVLDDVG